MSDEQLIAALSGLAVGLPPEAAELAREAARRIAELRDELDRLDRGAGPLFGKLTGMTPAR